MSLDSTLLEAIAVAPGTPAASAALLFTRLGDAETRLTLVPLIAALLAWKRGWRPAVLFAAIVLGGALIVTLLKAAIGRPRPDLLPHQDLVSSASMPSGHAANNLIVWLAAARLWTRSPWPAVAALLFAGAVGLSRVMLAVHWPSDVLVGWAIGIIWVLGCLSLFRR